MQETQVQSQAREDALEKEMATRSSILAWRIPWTEEPLWVHKEPLTPSSAENFTIAFPTTRGRASVGNIITDFISARWIQLKKRGGGCPPGICVLKTLLHSCLCSQNRSSHGFNTKTDKLTDAFAPFQNAPSHCLHSHSSRRGPEDFRPGTSQGPLYPDAAAPRGQSPAPFGPLSVVCLAVR